MLEQTLLQLRILGYNVGDRCYVRCLAGKGFNVAEDKLYPFDGYITLTEDSYSFTRLNPRSKGGGEQFTITDGHYYLTLQNQKGYGIYFIPNKGGRKDEEISYCQSFFYECDDISLEEQGKRIERLSLTPTLIIQTRYSLHVYYLLLEQNKDEWRKYQQRLIQLMDSDPSIHNESRLMRLAGFYHQKKGLAPVLIKIAYTSEAIYKRSQFDELLPDWDESRWSEVKEAVSDEVVKQRLEQAKVRREQQLSSIDRFPLEICLTKDDRQLISSGVSEGGRNKKGFKLACNLIATENWLKSTGYSLTGTAEDLFHEYADRCQPTINFREREQIWKSAQKTGKTPSLSDEALENCIKAWQWHQLTEQERQALKGSFGEPDPLAYDAYVKELEERYKVEQAISNESFIERLKRQASQVCRSYRRGFGWKIAQRKINQTEVKLPHTLTWGQDPIPPLSEYLENGQEAPTIDLNGADANEAVKARLHLAKLGYKVVIDGRPTGSGKSHCVPLYGGKVLYLDVNYKNPSIKDIEEKFALLVPRHQGLIRGEDGKLRKAKGWEEAQKAEVESNCHRANKLNTLAEKGYSSAQGKDLACFNCSYYGICQTLGFIAQRKEGLKQERIRAYPDQISLDFDLSEFHLIWEEAGQLIQATEEITASKRDFDAAINNLQAKVSSHFLFEALLPLRRLFDLDYQQGRDLAIQNFNLAPKDKYYGLSHEQLISLLGEPDAQLMDDAYFEEIRRALTLNPEDLFPEVDGIRAEKNGGSWAKQGIDARQVQMARNFLAREAEWQSSEKINSLPSNWLLPLLEIWTGRSKGIIAIEPLSKTHLLKITLPNDHHADLVSRGRLTTLLDATPDKKHLCAILKLNPNHLATLVDTSLVFNNLTVFNVNVDGIKSYQWSASTIERIKKALAVAIAQYGQENVGVMALKRYRKELGIIHWFGKDERGTNDFLDKKCLIIIGTPWENYGELRKMYQLTYGHLDSAECGSAFHSDFKSEWVGSFDEFYHDVVKGKYIQAIGRLRAHRRPNENLCVIFLGTDQNLDFLKETGAKVINQDMLEFCPEAAKRRKQDKLAILRFAIGLQKAGKKITQEAIALGLGCDQSWISKLFRGAQTLSWIEFRKIFQSLQDGQTGSGIFSNKLERNPVIRNWLELDPIGYLTEIVEVINNYGWDALRDYLVGVCPHEAHEILGMLALLMPNGEQIFGGLILSTELR